MPKPPRQSPEVAALLGLEIKCSSGHILTRDNSIECERGRGGNSWTECLICKKTKNEIAITTGANRESGLRFRYGVGEEVFNELWEKQLGLCAICQNGLNKYIAYNNKADRHAAHIDHDHITGIIRGLLCGNCNIGIGNLKDSIDILNRAIEYLAKSKERIN